MSFSWNRFNFSFAGRTGAALVYLDRFCTVLYLAGAAWVGGMLAWMAVTKTLWLLLLAAPMLATTALFSLSFLRNPALGLHLEWPVRRSARALNKFNLGGFFTTNRP
jgi:hypothetical protein